MASKLRSVSALAFAMGGCMLLLWLADDSRRLEGGKAHQVINNNYHRRLQDDNPFSALGEILIRLVEIILLIFGPGGGSTPTPSPVAAPSSPTPGSNPGSFNIRLQYDSSVPDSHIFLFEEAKTFFERIITQDIEDVPLSELSDTTPIAPGCTYSDVDDIDICIYYTNSVAFGVGGFNNRRFSGPNQPLPSTGRVAINADLVVDEFLRDLIVHEMAHALGIGTVDVCPNTPGDAAQAAYQSISGCTTPLPVTSNCGHLLESCLIDEMMTPTLWADGLNVFSSITIGWLEDLGYTVDYSPADVLDPTRLGTNPSGSCNCNRRLGETNPSLGAVMPVLSEKGYNKAHAIAQEMFGHNDGPWADGKPREQALAVTVRENDTLHTVVVRA